MKNTILSFLFILSNTILFSQVGTYSYLQPRTAIPNWTAAENPTEVGEFSIAHAMSMYVSVKSPNQFARARVFAHHNSNSDHPIMIRAFDTDERLTHWQLIPTKGASPLFYPEDTYDNALPALPLTTSSGTTINDAGFAFADQGVHQIRVNAGISTTKAKVVFSQDLEYGVSFQNGSYRAWAGHPGTMYFYIPKNAVTLDFNVSAGPLLLKDQNGIVKPLDSNFDIDLLPSDYDQVWSIDLPSNFQFSVKGMPFIMCTSVALANEVHASVEEGPNGEVVSHKWQVNLLNIKKDILQNGNLGDPTIMVPANYSNESAQWLANPLKNTELINAYRPFYSDAVFNSLIAQNTNHQDHWGGIWSATGVGNWDDFQNTPEIGLNGGNVQSLALGFLAGLDEPFNHYYQYQEELINRCAANFCLVLCKMDESETYPSYSGSDYPGHAAFVVGQKLLPEFHEIAPRVSPAIKEVLTEAVRHVMDRHYADYIVSARNQSAHFLPSYEAFAQATGDQFYTDLSRMYAARFINSQHPAGYFPENIGPCGSYNGITNYCTSVYYAMSEDSAMGEAMDRTYEFFNSTVGPEPGGDGVYVMTGGFNFNHRIPQGFFQEQWGGAKSLGRKNIPSIEKWTQRSDDQLQDLLQNSINGVTVRINGNLRTDKAGYWAQDRYTYYHPADNDCEYTWPAERSPYIKNFADELLAVKRDEYFTSIYFGTPVNNQWYIRLRENARAIHPREEDPTFGHYSLYSAVGGITPYVGGGLSTFWNQDYGTSLMATNWSPAYHNGLVMTVDEQQVPTRYWEDYLLTTHQFSETPIHKPSLQVSGEIEGQNVDYTRTSNFYDGYLEIEVEITPNNSKQVLGFYESIPLLTGNKKLQGQQITNGQDSMLDERPRNFILLENNHGFGTKILFDEFEDTVLKDGVLGGGSVSNGWSVKHIEMKLPTGLIANQPINFGYHMIPINELTKGLIGHWPWKAGGLDNSGYDLHLDSLSSPIYGAVEQDCRFISTTKNNFTRTRKFNTPEGDLTVSTWLKSNSSNWNNWAIGIHKSNVFSLSPIPGSKTIEAKVFNYQGMTLDITFDLSNLQDFDIRDWHFYALTCSESSLKLFVDGVEVAVSNTYFGKLNRNQAYIYFGSDGNNNYYFDGKIGETRLYNEALENETIEKLYTKKSCYSVDIYEDLEVWLKGGELGNYEQNSSLFRWKDASGNNYHAEQTNPARFPTINLPPTSNPNDMDADLTLTFEPYDELIINNAPILKPTDDWQVFFVTNPKEEFWQEIINFHDHYNWGIYASHWGQLGLYTYNAGTGAADTQFNATPPPSNGKANVYSLKKEGTTYYWYLNGNLLNSENKGANDVKNNTTNLWTIANHWSSGLDGSLAEILVYRSALTKLEQTTVEDYLCNKFNLDNCNPTVELEAKMFLEGAYDVTTQLMRDDLRSSGLIPVNQPYNTSPWMYEGSEQIGAGVLSVSTNDAIVDWVLVELRDKNNPQNILSTVAGLLQKDGDVVRAEDGVSPLRFLNMSVDDYYVSVRHRNHLGCMTLNLMSLSDTATTVDFSTIQTYGTNAQATIGSIQGLRAGNTNKDATISASDRSLVWNRRNLTGYLDSDCNLDGICNANDRSVTWNNRNNTQQLP